MSRAPLATSFFFHAPATPETYTLSLHDALPISEVALQHAVELDRLPGGDPDGPVAPAAGDAVVGQVPLRSEEHTSEFQSRFDLVCRLLLEKKKDIDQLLLAFLESSGDTRLSLRS